ncbi:MAG: RNA chaperone ProQ [Succinivibrionaceae bacterium]|nr:RNA chaperone ProQ [Succinivibrionaceae bacterium]
MSEIEENQEQQVQQEQQDQQERKVAKKPGFARRKKTPKPAPVVPRKYTPKEVIDFLCEKFPKCFFPFNSADVKPFKIGLLDDVVARLGDEISPDSKFSKTAIRQGIKLYAASIAYLDACKEGAARIDVDGNECGETITADQAKYAVDKKETVLKKIEERKKEKEEKAQREKEAAAAGEGEAGQYRNPNQNRRPRPQGDGYRRKPGGHGYQGQRNGQNRGYGPRNGGMQGRKPYTRPIAYDYLKVEIGDLQEGNFVSVRTGDGLVRGHVAKIEKDDVQVRLRNGSIVHTGVVAVRLIVPKPQSRPEGQSSES